MNDWLLEFTTDPVMRAEAAKELRAAYVDTPYPLPDLDEVICGALAVVAADTQVRAEEQGECNHVDDCTAKAVVLRHLAKMLNPTQEVEA